MGIMSRKIKGKEYKVFHVTFPDNKETYMSREKICELTKTNTSEAELFRMLDKFVTLGLLVEYEVISTKYKVIAEALINGDTKTLEEWANNPKIYPIK
jgi:hypothetical protein